MKTKEELNALKAEVEALREKLAGLTDEELKQVFGGTEDRYSGKCPFCKGELYWNGHLLRKKRDFFTCPKCGKLTHFWEGDRWVHGWIKD